MLEQDWGIEEFRDSGIEGLKDKVKILAQPPARKVRLTARREDQVFGDKINELKEIECLQFLNPSIP
jgi:hypothetical protein